MHILQLSDKKEGGGAEKLFCDTIDLLRQRGHRVSVHCAEEKSFFRRLFSYVFSIREYIRMKKKLQELQPQIIHIHNYCHLLSPSVLLAIARFKQKTKAVLCMSVHDFHLLCANNSFYRWKSPTEGLNCESCQGRFFSLILRRNCDRRGFFYNLLKYLQHFLAYRVLSLHKNIDCFICPSSFLLERLAKIIPREKCVLLPNPASVKIHGDKGLLVYPSLYIGRLDPVKGLHHFLEHDYSPEKFGDFAIIGTGDASYVKELKDLLSTKVWKESVHFLGHQKHDLAMAYLALSSRLIFPSLCYENCPLVILEAKKMGKEVFHYGHGPLPDLLKAPLLGQQDYIQRLEMIYEKALK